MKSVIGVFLLSFIAQVLTTVINDRPIIGVVSQEIAPKNQKYFPAHSSFIVASYVKAVESSGARVVPIVVNKPESYYVDILHSVNGVVLPGGGAKHGRGNPYYDTVRIIYRIAKQMNENGTFFPILGVCLGYEFLIEAANNDDNLFKNCSIFYNNYPIKFTESYAKTALYSRLNPDQAHTLQNLNSTFNWHIWCAYVEDFVNSSLNRDWRITSTSTSNQNVEFIASVEHIRYPFLGIQFHPEKIAFEWLATENIDHSEPILLANRYFYDQIVRLSKSNNNKFPNEELEKNSLIYNYLPRTTRPQTVYEQMYLF